jgi:hypothetical protein
VLKTSHLCTGIRLRSSPTTRFVLLSCMADECVQDGHLRLASVQLWRAPESFEEVMHGRRCPIHTDERANECLFVEDDGRVPSLPRAGHAHTYTYKHMHTCIQTPHTQELAKEAEVTVVCVRVWACILHCAAPVYISVCVWQDAPLPQENEKEEEEEEEEEEKEGEEEEQASGPHGAFYLDRVEQNRV